MKEELTALLEEYSLDEVLLALEEISFDRSEDESRKPKERRVWLDAALKLTAAAAAIYGRFNRTPNARTR